MTTADWHPEALEFEVVEFEPGPDEAHSLRLTSVIRDDYAIRVNYEIVPPPEGLRFGPFGEAEDDLGNSYDDSGGAYGRDPDRNRINGDLSFPLPAPEAKELVVRIEWEWLETWEGGKHTLRLRL